MNRGRKKKPKHTGKNTFDDRLNHLKPLVWIWIIIGASAWMFILGVLVGRGFVPQQFDINKIKKELTALIETAEKEERIELTAALNQLNDPSEIDIHDKLKTSAHDDKTLDIPREKLSSGLSKSATQNGSRLSPKSKKKKIPEADQTAESSEPARPLPDDHNTGKNYTVQVASFKTAGDAAKRVVQLKRMKFDAYMVSVDVENMGVRHRVMVGRYKNTADAKNMQRRLKKDHIHGFVFGGR